MCEVRIGKRCYRLSASAREAKRPVVRQGRLNVMVSDAKGYLAHLDRLT